MPTETLTCQQFTSFLVSQEPVYDSEIIKDIRPSQAGLVGFYKSSQFEPFSGFEHTFDRFRVVQPNVTKPWNRVNTDGCVGTPCDPDWNKIGWGSTRETYFLEEQSWETQLLCFDQIVTRTKAREHLSQIISDVLRPASLMINNYYLMFRALDYASRTWLADATGSAFTFSWDAGQYVYLNTSGDPTSKLTPAHIMRRVRAQYMVGAMARTENHYESLELQTDQDTFRNLAQEDPVLLAAWRFADFGIAAKEYYQYGLRGFVGDFMVRVPDFQLRFNKVAAGRYQLVLPYVNSAATEGIGDEYNPDYDTAQYAISFINHRRALNVKTFQPAPVNPEMPFLMRDYGGKWKFVMDNLGADDCGKPIENKLRNKGQFVAQFRLAVKPEHPEWLEAIFHKRELPCITVVETCADDPGYPAQDYSSDPETCDSAIYFTPVPNDEGNFIIAANTAECDGVAETHAEIGGVNTETLAELVTSLNTNLSALGTWAVVDGSTTQIQLTDTECDNVTLTFV